MKQIQLSKRLLAAAGMVTKGNIVADVGCDHAYTSIYLCQAGIAPKVIAMDVNKGPLVGAKAHVEEAGLSENIDIRLSDGLQRLIPGEADTVLLCGMGGLLMIKILSDYPEATASLKELILHEEGKYSRLFDNLKDNPTENAQKRLPEVEEKLALMREALACL